MLAVDTKTELPNTQTKASEKDVFVQLKKVYQQHYLDRLFQRINDYQQDITSFKQAVDRYHSNSGESYKHLVDLKQQLLSVVEKLNQKPEPSGLQEKYPSLGLEVEQIIQQAAASIIEEQAAERFHAVEGDHRWLRLRKRTKRLFFWWSTLHIRVANLFRKNKKPIPYWKHQIPYQSLLKKHFSIQMVKSLEMLTAIFHKGICKLLINTKGWEENVVNNNLGVDEEPAQIMHSLNENIDQLKESLKNSFDKIFETHKNTLLREYEIVDTMELPLAKLAPERLQKYERQAMADWSSHHLKWQNTLFAFTEEWKSDLQLFYLGNHALYELEQIDKTQKDKLEKNLLPVVGEIRKLASEAKKEVDAYADGVANELTKLNYKLSKKLDGDLVPKLREGILSLNIPNLIDRLEDSIERCVENYSGDRVIVKDEAFDRPMKSDEFQWVSTYDLISFESLNVLGKEIRVIKNKAFNELNNTIITFEDLDHIVSFSFDSAISALKSEECTNDEGIATAREGLIRIEKRLEDLLETLDEIISETNEALSETVRQFADSLIALSINENLGALQLRIAKAKASQHARQFTQVIIESVTNAIKRTIQFFVNSARQITSKYYQWRSQYLLVAPKTGMSRDVSNFLLESQQSIEKLPLVYRRLFKIEALKDTEFFVGRTQELEQVNEAFNNWTQGRYAATAVLGEQWSGLTSFMNLATNEVKFNCQINRISPSHNISRESQLVEMFQELLGKEELTNLQQIEDHLNQAPKRVIIIEDLQNLYLRSVSGFVALRALFELINNTHQQVFWMVTANIYTWQYLSRTINIKDFFSYQIELQEFSEQQIVDIILKRNRISGFTVHFLADEQKSTQKKLSKMDEEEQQAYLQKEFFTSLNSFAKSNVSMALLFWLMSTREVDENVITINTFKKPDFSFLTALSADKVYILQALVLHDGLEMEQLAITLNITMSQTKMHLIALMEDGILFQRKQVYLVNPIVYRSVINLLKSKNLIH